jgi:hypothetical protein
MPTPLDNLRAAYANLCTQLAEVTADPRPSYSTDGKSVSWEEHYNGLVERIQKLAQVPGVAPDQNPTFDVIG